MIHENASPLAGKTVRIAGGRLAGSDYVVEDWWDRVAGRSWMHCDGNPACLEYAVASRTPIDNEVLYGKVGGAGKLIHISDIGEATA